MKPSDQDRRDAFESPEGALQSALALLAGDQVEQREDAENRIFIIVQDYRARLGLNETAVTYQAKMNRLADIQKTARKLWRLLDGIEPECLNELLYTGRGMQVPAEWDRPEPNLWRLCEVVRPCHPMLDWDKVGNHSTARLLPTASSRAPRTR